MLTRSIEIGVAKWVASVTQALINYGIVFWRIEIVIVRSCLGHSLETWNLCTGAIPFLSRSWVNTWSVDCLEVTKIWLCWKVNMSLRIYTSMFPCPLKISRSETLLLCLSSHNNEIPQFTVPKYFPWFHFTLVLSIVAIDKQTSIILETWFILYISQLRKGANTPNLNRIPWHNTIFQQVTKSNISNIVLGY